MLACPQFRPQRPELCFVSRELQNAEHVAAGGKQVPTKPNDELIHFEL